MYDKTKWIGRKPTVKVAQNGGKSVTVGTTSTQILAANDNRTCFYIKNNGTGTVYISFSSTATLSDSYPLAAGEELFCDHYTGEVSGIAEASQDVRVIEV